MRFWCLQKTTLDFDMQWCSYGQGRIQDFWKGGVRHGELIQLNLRLLRLIDKHVQFFCGGKKGVGVPPPHAHAHFLCIRSKWLFTHTHLRGQPSNIQGGGARSFRWRKIIYFKSKWRENIFFTFSVTGYVHGAWVQIFFSPLLRRNLFISPFFEEEFIYFKILPSPLPGYLLVAP